MKKIDYDYFGNENNKKTIDDILEENEKILWKAKPKKLSIASRLLINNIGPILSIPCLIIMIVVPFLIAKAPLKYIFPAVVLFLSSLIVPLMIKGIISDIKEQRNTKYFITNKRIVVITGKNQFVKEEVMISDIIGVNIKQSKMDSMFGVYDLYIIGFKGLAVLEDIKEGPIVKRELDQLVYNKEQNEKFYSELDTCPYCGSSIAKNLKKCPYCGVKINRN